MDEQDVKRTEQEEGGVAEDGPANELEGRTRVLGAKVLELEEALSSAHASLDRSERVRRIDIALMEAGAVDLETARIVVERGLEEEGAEVQTVVTELRGRKPFLFRKQGAPLGSLMSSAVSDGAAGLLDDAAQRAAEFGDRGALLDYLRVRRTLCG